MGTPLLSATMAQLAPPSLSAGGVGVQVQTECTRAQGLPPQEGPGPLGPSQILDTSLPKTMGGGPVDHDVQAVPPADEAREVRGAPHQEAEEALQGDARGRLQAHRKGTGVAGTL